MDRLDIIRVFVTVAKLGSFAAAARQLRLSPSATTRAIAQLEDQLGLGLIVRTTRSLHLTELGKLYLDSCLRIIEEIDTAEVRVRGGNAEPRGELVVAAPIVFGRLHVLPIITGILAEHRSLTVRLTLSDRNVHLVDDGIDIAVRIGELSDSSLIAVRLGIVSRVLLASPAYLLQRGVPTTPSDLQGHDVIAFESLDATNEWRFDTGQAPVSIKPRLSVNSADAAIAAAEAGVGITRAFSYQVEAAIRAGRLRPVLPTFSTSGVPVSLVYPPRRGTSANVSAFVACARAYCKAHPIP